MQKIAVGSVNDLETLTHVTSFGRIQISFVTAGVFHGCTQFAYHFLHSGKGVETWLNGVKSADNQTEAGGKDAVIL